MMTFAFRLRFKFPPKSFIAEDADFIVITMPFSDQQITLQSRPAKSLKNTVLYDAMAGEFSSLDAAISYGQKTRDAIAICCALLGMGVEIGKHDEFFDVSDVKIDSSNGQSYIQPKDLNGLVVYPQDSKVEYTDVGLSDKGGPSAERFQRAFIKSFELSEHLDDGLGLAFELYNSHLFEVSSRARFLQLVSTIECLVKPKRQNKTIVEHVENLVELSEKDLAAMENVSPDDRRDFIQRLHHLKRESISSACRNLVQRYLGDEAVARFQECYNLRSKLVHEGQISSKVELLDHYFELEKITQDLLYAMISGRATQ